RSTLESRSSSPRSRGCRNRSVRRAALWLRFLADRPAARAEGTRRPRRRSRGHRRRRGVAAPPSGSTRGRRGIRSSVIFGTSLAPPEYGRPFQFPFFNEPVSYHEAMETRLVRGDWGSGRVAAWMRQRVPLVAGSPTSPLERVLVAADSGSGVSAAIEHKRFTAINADLTVSVHRPLEGEWVGLDCLSIYEPHGVGLADTRLHDMHGPIGRAL